MNKVIGFIGLGAMGKPMAKNLIKAGMHLICYNDKNKAAIREMVEEGAEEATSCRDVAKRSDVIITVLPADRQIMDVYASGEGILSSVRDGTGCIDMTSALGDTIKNVAEMALRMGKKITILDAPVSGGVQAACDGNLTIMAGGDRNAVEEYRPLLEIMGKKIFYTGGIGSGKAIKMINQLLNACNTYIMSEALYMADTMGIDRNLLYGVVNESSGSSWVFKNNLPRYVFPQDFQQGFRLELMKKDIALCVKQAMNENSVLPVSNLIYQIYEAMSKQGNDMANYNIVSQWVYQQNNRKPE